MNDDQRLWEECFLDILIIPYKIQMLISYLAQVLPSTKGQTERFSGCFALWR